MHNPAPADIAALAMSTHDNDAAVREWARGLKPATFAEIWLDFRSCGARGLIGGIKSIEIDEGPVLGVNPLIADMCYIMQEDEVRQVQRIGRDEIMDNRLPWSGFAMVCASIADTPSVVLVATGVLPQAGEQITMIKFQCMGSSGWVWSVAGWFAPNDPEMYYTIRNDIDLTFGTGRGLLDDEACTLLFILGLLTLPPTLVERESVSRPITKGRTKPHPLSPGTVLRLSFDPVRIIAATKRGGSHASPSYQFPRRAAIVTNKKGTTFKRRSTIVMKHLPPRDQVRVVRMRGD